MKQKVAYMLSNNIAEPRSRSPWSSLCILIDKPVREYISCTDYWQVNAVTILNAYPLPRMNNCVDHVGSANFVTTHIKNSYLYIRSKTSKKNEIQCLKNA